MSMRRIAFRHSNKPDAVGNSVAADRVVVKGTRSTHIPGAIVRMVVIPTAAKGLRRVYVSSAT
jgi:hypothetical protein